MWMLIWFLAGFSAFLAGLCAVVGLCAPAPMWACIDCIDEREHAQGSLAITALVLGILASTCAQIYL